MAAFSEETPSSSSQGPPPVDGGNRRKRRFYEPLVLLHVLDPNGEKRTSRCPSEDHPEPQQMLSELRRSFLDQLAYICDHMKGGETVTATALEAEVASVTFWIVCNTTVSPRTLTFLFGILETLQSVSSLPSEDARNAVEKEIAQRCIDFNIKRIKEYRTLLQRPLQKCLEALAKSKEPADQPLECWLQQFLKSSDNLLPDLPRLCRFSYQQRHSESMIELQRHIGNDILITDVESIRQSFLLTRHYIGRLGSHLRAAKILTAAGWRMRRLFENFTIKTIRSPERPSLPPLISEHTTLDRIAIRMLRPGSSELAGLQQNLKILDARFNLQQKLDEKYKDRDFKPRVHAELNLLEHFYRHRLRFVDDDKYIGCSKPACYCCYQYIRFHPGGFVLPACHGIRYTSWRPPDAVDADDPVEKAHRRNIMNKVIKQIRLDVIRQIKQCRGPSAWHPDTTTGITHTSDKGRLEPGMNYDSHLLKKDEAMPTTTVAARKDNAFPAEAIAKHNGDACSPEANAKRKYKALRDKAIAKLKDESNFRIPTSAVNSAERDARSKSSTPYTAEDIAGHENASERVPLISPHNRVEHDQGSKTIRNPSPMESVIYNSNSDADSDGGVPLSDCSCHVFF